MEKITEQIAVVADSATALGFRLAGVDKTFAVKGRDEARGKLSELFLDSSLGIIVTTEKIAEQCDRKLKQKISESAKPIVITVPGIEGPIEQEESIAKMIKRALGVQLKGNGV